MLTWFAQIIRSFFFWIDYNLFSFIETLYNLLIDLSRTTILTQGDIKVFADRVQLLLGVFMLFKVAFSIITYVINPDEMTDKSKGFAKMGQNVVISLILLVVTPYIFGMAYDLQVMVLEDNTIASLIFGSTDDDTFIETGGQKLSFSVMIPFFRPDTGISELASCNNLYQNNGKEFNEECLSGLKLVVKDWKDSDLDDRVIGNYTTGVVNRNFGLTFRSEAVTFLTNDSQFVFSYKIILSTAAAVVVILLMLTFAMDVALRSVKLAFLQLISPIPIISYIDPKQGKDGMFKKWYSMCFSTYISLFIRLLALYFGLYLIDIVINRGFSDVLTGEVSQWGWFNTGMWINLFMIIGILMFIKQLPKILEGFGIKLDGGGKFTLNPFKKFEEEAFGGKQILGAAGGLTSGVADRGARIMAARGAKNKFKAAAGGLIGIPGSAIRGFRDGKGFASGRDAQNAVNRRLREGRIKGLTPASTYLDYLGSKFGLDDATLEKRKRIDFENEKSLKDMKKRAEDDARTENLEATRLEHENAQRKETMQRLTDAHSKGDAVMKYVESYVKKKANFGSVSEQTVGKFLDVQFAYNSGTALTKDIYSSDGIKLASAGDTVDSTLFSTISSRLGINAQNQHDIGEYDYAFSEFGYDSSRDITLSDGTTIAAGTKIDSSVISKIMRSLNRDYTDSIKINNDNLEMMRKVFQSGGSLSGTVTIGDRTFTGSVSAADLQVADRAAYDYEKYANEQVQNLFASGGVADVKAQGEFESVRSQYESAVNSANESIVAYNATYSGHVARVNNSVQYSALDRTLTVIDSGSDIRDMRTESTRIESEVTRHKQKAVNAKDNVTGHLLDEKGKVIIDSATGLPKEFGIEEFESIHNPRKAETDEIEKQHTESRSTWQKMSSK